MTFIDEYFISVNRYDAPFSHTQFLAYSFKFSGPGPGHLELPYLDSESGLGCLIFRYVQGESGVRCLIFRYDQGEFGVECQIFAIEI